MKSALFLLILILPLTLFCQLKGTYVALGHAAIKYQFCSQDSFAFGGYGSLGQTLGQGTYSMREDSINLLFGEMHKPEIVPEFVHIQPFSKDTRSDTAKTRFSVLDAETKKILPFSMISIFNKRTSDTILVYEMDISGVCTFVIPKSTDSLEAFFYALEYNVTRIDIEPEMADIEVGLRLINRTRYIESGTHFQYVIIKHSKHELHLQSIQDGRPYTIKLMRIKKRWDSERVWKEWEKFEKQ